MRTSAFESLESRRYFAVVAIFQPALSTLLVAGDDLANSIVIGRTTGGDIVINGGAVPINGGTATVTNTSLISIEGAGGANVITFDETNGTLPNAQITGGADDDTITGGSGFDTIRGNGGNDVLDGAGGIDQVFGGAGDDTVSGGIGDDNVFGDADNDRLVWNAGDGTDVLEGGSENDTVEVNGGNGAELFTVTANGTRVRFDEISPLPSFLDIGTSEKFVLNANGGNDSFSATGNLSTLIQLVIDGGASNDTLFGGNGADSLLGGDGDDFIDGNQGNDFAFMGNGNDTFNWDPGDGSDVVEGQADTDTLQFNGANIAEVIDLSANGTRLRLTRNIAAIVMDADDVERVNYRALGGADVIAVNDLGATDVTRVNIDLASSSGIGDASADQIQINGGSGDDSMQISASLTDGVTIVDGQTAINVQKHEPTLDTFALRGLGGADTFAFNSLSGIDGTSITVDLSDGQADQVVFNLSSSGDFFGVSDAGAGTSITGLSPSVSLLNAEATLDSLRINAGGGSDSININQANANGRVRNVIIDAGDQTDTIQIANTALDGVVKVLPSAGDDNVNVNTDGALVANATFVGTQRIGTLSIGAGGRAEIAAGSRDVLVVSSALISSTGKLDLQDNAMIVDYSGGTALPSVTTLIRNARNGGGWNGSGITSSFAAAASPAVTGLGAIEATQFKSIYGATAMFNGQPIDNTAVLVKYTYYGDVDFNGKVDGADYARVDVNFNLQTANGNTGGWFNGDFDYNGKIDGADYALIDAAFNTQGAVLRPRVGSFLRAF